MNKKLTIVACCVVGLYLVGHFIYYGSLTRNCIYTEEKIPVPSELEGGQLVTTQQSFAVVGLESDDLVCSTMYANVARRVISIESRGWLVSDPAYPPGITIQEIPIGTTFKVIDSFRQDTHGIANIEGGGSMEYMTLQDGRGTQYVLAISGLGINDHQRFVKFVSPGYEQMLEYAMFAGKEGEYDRVGIKYFHLDTLKTP